MKAGTFSRAGHQGLTLTELILVMAIMTLIATLAVPATVSRITQAKVSTAKAEVQALAQAQMMCGMTHGYYVPLQLLDDIPNGTAATAPDDLDNETQNPQVIDLGRTTVSNIASPTRLDSFDPKLVEMVDNWAGPFSQPQRVFRRDNDLTDIITVRRDHPLDPWRHPYIFYGPGFIVGTGAASVGSNTTTPPDATDMDDDLFSDGQFSLFNSTPDDIFDRWAIVSLGPNGVSDRAAASDDDIGDDIIYFFDGPTSTTAAF